MFVVNKRRRRRSPSSDTDENEGSSRTTTVADHDSGGTRTTTLAHHTSGETHTSQNRSTGKNTHEIELLPSHELWVSSNDHGTMSHIQTPFGIGSHIEPDITNMSSIKVGNSVYTSTDTTNIFAVKVNAGRYTPTDTTSAIIDRTGIHIQSDNTNIPDSISGTIMPDMKSRRTDKSISGTTMLDIKSRTTDNRSVSKGRSNRDLHSPSSVASFQQSSQFPSKHSSQAGKEAGFGRQLTNEDHSLHSRETPTNVSLHYLKSSGWLI